MTRRTLKVYPSWDLDSSTSSTARPSSSIVWNRCHVFYSADSEPVAGEHPDSCLRSGTRGSSAVSSGSSYSNMERSNSLVFRGLGGCRRGLHRGVWCSLESVRFYVLTSCASGYGFCTRKVGYVDHGIVEG